MVVVVVVVVSVSVVLTADGIVAVAVVVAVAVIPNSMKAGDKVFHVETAKRRMVTATNNQFTVVGCVIGVRKRKVKTQTTSESLILGVVFFCDDGAKKVDGVMMCDVVGWLWCS
jgi:hypothetical protein